MDPWRALGPLWAQLAFQGVSNGDLFVHVGHFRHPWGPLGTHLAPLWSTLGAQGSHFGAFGHHLGDLGQLVKIAMLR